MVSMRCVIIQWVSLPVKFLHFVMHYILTRMTEPLWDLQIRISARLKMWLWATEKSGPVLNALLSVWANEECRVFLQQLIHIAQVSLLLRCRITASVSFRPAGLFLSITAALEEKQWSGTAVRERTTGPPGFAATDAEDAFIWFWQKLCLER